MEFRIKQALVSAVFIAAGVLPGAVAALPIDRTLTINVYQVCDNLGANCAQTGSSVGDTFFAAATNRIWEQAGISIGYNFVSTINNSAFLHLDDSTVGRRFRDIAQTTGNYLSATAVDMFLVNTYDGAYGVGWSGAGGLVMAMDTILAYAAGGRIDTMAHELGHNLGLSSPDDPDYGGITDPGHSNNPNHLMASGSIRNVPLTIADIAPHGMGYDQLTAFQINLARQSTLLTAVPEPEAWALFAVGLIGLRVAARRRQAVRG